MNANQPSTLNRRDFLRRSAVGAAAAAMGLTMSCRTAPGGKKIPLGVQLYTVREQCKNDFPGTLKTVSQIGFKGVEFAGYWNLSAPEIRKLLDDDGLVACGTHTGYETVRGDALKKPSNLTIFSATVF
jgi:hypothetical protein